MEDDYNDPQDSVTGVPVQHPNVPGVEGQECPADPSFSKDYSEVCYDEEDEDGGGFRNRGGRSGFRGRGQGPPPGWMRGGPPGPMRFRGRGYGPGGPPMRGRGGFFRGRGGPRFNNNGFDNWGPMGPPPPMMGGPPNFGPPMMGGPPMGPPPNMMQPPPFGGPPGMPPPNMQPPTDLWVETKSEEGKSYYYHNRTRETTWTRPDEGPNVKIITQAEMEAMSTSMMGNMNGPMMGGPMPGPMGPMGMGMPPVLGPPGTSGPPPFMQPPPWVNKDAPMKDASQPEMMNTNEEEDSAPGDPDNNSPSNGAANNFWNNWNPSWRPPMNQPPPNVASSQSLPQMGAQQMPTPQLGAPQNIPVPQLGTQVPPQIGAGPPQMNTPQIGTQHLGAGHMGAQHPGAGHMGAQQFGAGQMGAQQFGAGQMGQNEPMMQQMGMQQMGQSDQEMRNEPPKMEAPPIPSNLLAAANEWTVHRAPDNRMYYYHAKRQQSVWEKPLAVKQLEELQNKILRGELGKDDNMDDDKKVEVIDVDAYEEAQNKASAIQAEKQRLEKERQEKEKAEKEKAEKEEKERIEKEKAEKEAAEKEKAEKEVVKDRSRPITSTPISGTPWCVVWTGDNHVFFFNPAEHSSVWERPAALVGRADVDKAVSQPPEAVIRWQRKLAEEAAKNAGKNAGKSTAKNAAKNAANGESKRAADSDDSDAEPAKKAKVEEKPPAQTKKSKQMMEVTKEAAAEAETKAAKERAKIPFEQRYKTFVQMLRDNKVSAFSTWEKELQKIVFDERYLVLNYKERKEVFEKYVRERAEEERKEKKNRLQQKKAAFKTLLEEAKIHSKSSFLEFSNKYAKDERFKEIEKQRDRESYFNEYLGEMRKKEKEEKEKKREQVKADFLTLLREKNVDRRSRWTDVKKKIDLDPRYKAVDSSSLKEHYFNDYCKMMKEERKKEKDSKDKDRSRSSSKKEKKDKDREKEKEKEKEQEKEKTDSKKEKGSDKTETATDEEKRQSTPPPEEWADIIGVPEKDRREKQAALERERKKRNRSNSLKSPEMKSPDSKIKSPTKSPLKKTPKSPDVDEFKLKSPVKQTSDDEEEPIKSPKGKKMTIAEMKAAEVRIVPLEARVSPEFDDDSSEDMKLEEIKHIEEKKTKGRKKKREIETRSQSSDEFVTSPKRLRSSKKELPSPAKGAFTFGAKKRKIIDEDEEEDEEDLPKNTRNKKAEKKVKPEKKKKKMSEKE